MTQKQVRLKHNENKKHATAFIITNGNFTVGQPENVPLVINTTNLHTFDHQKIIRENKITREQRPDKPKQINSPPFQILLEEVFISQSLLVD